MKKVIQSILSLATLLTLNACDSLSVIVNDAPVRFHGIQSITLTENGTYQLSWDAGKEGERYKIYMKQSSEAPEGYTALPKIKGEQAGFLLARRSEVVNSNVTGDFELLDEADTNQYELKTVVDPDLFYSFVVVRASSQAVAQSRIPGIIAKTDPTFRLNSAKLFN